HEEQGLDPTYVHLERFFESVRSRTQPQQDAIMGHRAASAAHMVNQSLRKKQAVEWDFERDRVKA
ncbi:MAG TPA: gfo/Idh/MocA family oxidoreductase, partial [Acidobacteriota bacterium]|nr:gfo/Idh/MocA family oxidoreductase [Acidobacteriota bacterium]